MKIGYARVSTKEQSFDLQVDALQKTGCQKIYQEVASGAKSERPVLDNLLKDLRGGDILIIWKLDRLGRSLTHLVELVGKLMDKDVFLQSINDPMKSNRISTLLMAISCPPSQTSYTLRRVNMTSEGKALVYQLRVWLQQISPAIWRRLLVRSDSTIADLHYTLQIVMNWTDFHLHQFIIRGKRYGVSRVEGPIFSDNARRVQLRDFNFRVRERFSYEYDFGDLWQHEIRVEKQLPLDPNKIYPVCISGARLAPPEACVRFAQ